MSIEISIIQECDGCASFRKFDRDSLPKTVTTIAEVYTRLGRYCGWREVQPNVWLCPACINNALSNNEERK